jgi:hypothetical protein
MIDDKRIEELARLVKDARSAFDAVVGPLRDEEAAMKARHKAELERLSALIHDCYQRRLAVEGMALAEVGPAPAPKTIGATTVWYMPRYEQCLAGLRITGDPIVHVGGGSAWRCRRCGGIGAGGLSCMDCGARYDDAQSTCCTPIPCDAYYLPVRDGRDYTAG